MRKACSNGFCEYPSVPAGGDISPKIGEIWQNRSVRCVRFGYEFRPKHTPAEARLSTIAHWCTFNVRYLMTFSTEAIIDLMIMVFVGGGIAVVVLLAIYWIALHVVRDERQDSAALKDTQPDALRVMRRALPPDPNEWDVPRPSHDVDCSDGNGAGTV